MVGVYEPEDPIQGETRPAELRKATPPWDVDRVKASPSDGISRAEFASSRKRQLVPVRVVAVRSVIGDLFNLSSELGERAVRE